MITPRENVKRTLRRGGFSTVPLDYVLCDSQIESFKKKYGHNDYQSFFEMGHRSFEMKVQKNYSDGRSLFKREIIPEDTRIDEYGIGHSKGSEWAFHMTRMHHPLKGADLNEIIDYPYPSVPEGEKENLTALISGLHARGLASFAFMQMTVWEASWYMRSMEELMMDMMMEDERATVLLDKITEFACAKVRTYTEAGADIVSLGDDIGTQESIMMDVPFWERWLKPRLSKVIETARAVNPDVLIFYHSCGYIIPFIEQLIELGIDILNPVQPECMSFNEVHEKYGDRLSFWGTLGTQDLLPYGTPGQVKETSISRLEQCGSQGGIVLGPTHMVEPEVPWDNLMAIVEGVKEFELKHG